MISKYIFEKIIAKLNENNKIFSIQMQKLFTISSLPGHRLLCYTWIWICQCQKEHFLFTLLCHQILNSSVSKDCIFKEDLQFCYFKTESFETFSFDDLSGALFAFIEIYNKIQIYLDNLLNKYILLLKIWINHCWVIAWFLFWNFYFRRKK